MESVSFSEWKSWCESQVNKGIYLWGGQNVQLKNLSEAYIERHETSTANAKRVIKLWKQRQDVYPDAYAVDCSGLLMHYLQNVKGVCGDKTADGIYKICTPITKSEAKKGDFVFKGTSSKKSHIGYIIDNNGTIVSAKGRDYGVVNNETGWKYWARPSFFIFDDEPAPSPSKGYPITRNLKKGSKGPDVGALQQALIASGIYPKGGVDNSYGSGTVTAVKTYQKQRGLKADGIAGCDTITALSETKIVYWAK